MRRNKHESPISLFSFQDIIMSVVGIVILITLLLILKLIAQSTDAPPTTASAQELQEQIDSLSPVLAEIQNEIAQQHQAKLQSIATPQTQDQIDALLAAIKRLDAECVELDKEIKDEKDRAEILKNDLQLKSLPEDESRIKEMQEQLNRLKAESEELLKKEKVLQSAYAELTSKNQELEVIAAAAAAPKQLNVIVQKRPDKTTFLCVYGQDGLTVIPTNGAAQKTFTSQSDFYRWIDSRNIATEHFVIYFRPSRFGRYREIIDRIKIKGFDVGYQVIGETTNVVSFSVK
ncbi:MAG: hypothetical protein LBK06_01570 [Planctomycetaceae bacterium]|jgi:hypothetical protein|nr:hypothetical protein [Planctomycetaceae bacterium]